MDVYKAKYRVGENCKIKKKTNHKLEVSCKTEVASSLHILEF